MTPKKAHEIQGVLTESIPDAQITVDAQRDGAKVEIVLNGTSHKLSIGNGYSVLLNLLITGFAD
jgi:hypothetical protein